MISQELLKELQTIVREDHGMDLSMEKTREFGEFLVNFGKWAKNNQEVLKNK